MTDRELLALNKIGLIPGPGEDEPSFLMRVEAVKKKFKEGEWIPESQWDWVRQYLDQLFDVKPLYICAFYSNRHLAPWQGAATWIDGKSFHSIQLRRGLKKGSYLGLYSREEILAHEAVHAARSGFEEDEYEEFFAYMTSEKKWRRVLGPIFQRPWEVWPFAVAALAGVVWSWAYLIAAGWMGVGFFRLIQRHSRLKRAAAQIFERVKDPRTVRAILLRLTAQEINGFSKQEDISRYALKQTCPRWKVIRHYFGETLPSGK